MARPRPSLVFPLVSEISTKQMDAAQPSEYHHIMNKAKRFGVDKIRSIEEFETVTDDIVD